MEKISRPDGSEIFSTEHDQSPEELRRKVIEAQIRNFYESQYFLGKGENPATSGEVQEKIRRETEERMRQSESSGAENVVSFPARENPDRKDEKRSAA